MILRLQQFWDKQGCALLQPYDIEVGAGTFHTATFLRAIGPEPWNAAYVQPLAPPEGWPLRREPEPPAALLPVPGGAEAVAAEHPGTLPAVAGSTRVINLKEHDIRFVEDDWESPTLGAWGLGWEVWLDGMGVTQFTYFQEVGSLTCKPVLGEITYGLERLAMYLQGVENVYDPVWAEGPGYRITHGDVYHQNEVEQSKYNFEHSNVEMLFRHFGEHESEAKRLMAANLRTAGLRTGDEVPHTFNLPDARRHLGHRARRLHPGRIAPWRAKSRRPTTTRVKPSASHGQRMGSANNEQDSARRTPYRGTAAESARKLGEVFCRRRPCRTPPIVTWVLAGGEFKMVCHTAPPGCADSAGAGRAPDARHLKRSCRCPWHSMLPGIRARRC